MTIDIQTFRSRIGSFQQPNFRNAGDSYTHTGSSESSDVNNKAAKFIAIIAVLLWALNHTHRVPKIASDLKATDFAKILPRRAIQIQLCISGIEPNPGPTTPCFKDITERSYNVKQEQFRKLQSRRDTFTNQHSRFQRPTWEQIAEAGFYYTGCDDECCCFACGCGLGAWEPGDDPWKEHCRYSDDCPYVREVRGDTFVNRNRRRPDPTADETATNHPAIGGLSLNQDTDAQRHDQNVDRVQRERATSQHDNRNDTASLIDDYVQANLENPNLVYPMLFQ